MDKIKLKFESGPRTGETILLAGRSMVFGRTTVSEIVLDWDPRVSSRHMEIECIAGEFLLRDLQSRNGTKVNGQGVKSCSLAPGDEIELGNTRLRVEVQVRSEPKKKKIDADSEGSFDPFKKVDPKVKQRTSSGTGSDIEAAEPGILRTGQWGLCPSHICRLQGELSEPDTPCRVFKKIHSSCEGEVFFLLDFKRLGEECPLQDVALSSPFDTTLGPDALLQLPLFASTKELPEWEPLVDRAWGQDAMIAFGTKLSKIELVDGFSELLYGTSAGKKYRAGGMLGFCWPAVMNAVLFSGMSGICPAILRLADWLWLEDENAGESWQLYGSQETVTSLAAKAGIEVTEEIQTST